MRKNHPINKRRRKVHCHVLQAQKRIEHRDKLKRKLNERLDELDKKVAEE